jgi:hypothetical protein
MPASLITALSNSLTRDWSVTCSTQQSFAGILSGRSLCNLSFKKWNGYIRVLFQDKPVSVLYFEECLIDRASGPSAQKLNYYLNELRINSLGGFHSVDETSELAGEILGSIASDLIIGQCIVAVQSVSGNRREIRQLKKCFQELLDHSKQYSDKAWTISLHEWGRVLDNRLVAVGMSRSARYLTESGQPGNTLESEIKVGPRLREFRYSVMKEFSPVTLRQQLWRAIFEMTGVQLDEFGQPKIERQ